jgi:hypothetical protein
MLLDLVVPIRCGGHIVRHRSDGPIGELAAGNKKVLLFGALRKDLIEGKVFGDCYDKVRDLFHLSWRHDLL